MVQVLTVPAGVQNGMSHVITFWKQDPTHKRLKRTIFIRTKHSMRMLVVISFFKLEDDI